MLVVGSCKKELHQGAAQIDEHVALRVDDSASMFIVMCVNHDTASGSLRISNKLRIESTLQRFGFEDVKYLLTPVPNGVQVELDANG